MDEKLKVLVSAGDTFEAIDEVRRITHLASGRLGSLIADAFIEDGAEVTYLCGKHSLMPAQMPNKVVKIDGVVALEREMKNLLSTEIYDSVILSMAVSDYTVSGMAVKEDLIEKIVENIMKNNDFKNEELLKDIINTTITSIQFHGEGKISSDLDDLLVFLSKAPKVIRLVKQMQPETLLVGFKLLTNVLEEDLIRESVRQINTSDSDMVLANDSALITGDTHIGLLIDENGLIDRQETKQDIAKSIVTHVKKKIYEA